MSGTAHEGLSRVELLRPSLCFMIHAPVQPRPSRLPSWQVPLVVGMCFGLGYGITQRLMTLGWTQYVQLGQGFELRPFPGTTLETLRLRFGAGDQPIRADLDPQADPQAPGAAARGALDASSEPQAPHDDSTVPEDSQADPSREPGPELAPPPPPVLPPPAATP